MTYRVEYDSQAEAAIDNHVEYLREEGVSDETITGWLLRVYDRIESLQDRLRSYIVAELLSKLRGYEIRRMNVGEFAVFYRVIDDRRVVEILDFRHGRRRPLEDTEADDA